jgi:hypothetical protein
VSACAQSKWDDLMYSSPGYRYHFELENWAKRHCMNRTVVFLLAAVIFTVFHPVPAADRPHTQHATATLYASSLLLGVQLGAKKGAAELKMPSPVASCLLALDASSLTDVVESVLVGNLTQAELRTADAFFETTAGKKYAQLGALDVYTSVGETPPGEPPTVSDAESKQIEDFNGSQTGKKLWQVLDNESSRQKFGARLLDLGKSCGAARR